MDVPVRVATANINRDLDRAAADAALDLVLAEQPDLVGLQEWGWSRRAIFRRGDYRWFLPLFGGTVVGACADRFDPVGFRGRILDGVERAERTDRPFGLEPPRVVCAGRYTDRIDGTAVALLSYHLAPGVQVGTDGYRADRPVLTARHRREVAHVGRLVSAEMDAGREVYAVGDANFDRVRLPGLTSAWVGREVWPGTLGPVRKVDDVHGPGPADEVTVVPTASDHDAVVALRRRHRAGR